MAEGVRSPFGKLLRAYRQRRGLSQAGLVDLITQRNLVDPEFAKLGVVTEKAIANLEAASRDPSRWVRPRPQTVSLLLTALDIPSGSPEEEAFLAAAEEARSRTVPAAPAPRQSIMFVPDGREAQLQQLQGAWASARQGTPAFVLIQGDSGTGKTRLIQHLLHLIRLQEPQTLITIGASTPNAAALEPYQPFLHAFNHAIGLAAADTSQRGDDLRARDIRLINNLLTLAPGLVGPMINETALLARIEEMGLESRSLVEMISRFRALNSPIETSTRLDQATRFVTSAAEMQPTVVVLEDMHWAGDLAITLLLHLQRQLQMHTSLPLLVLVSWRSGDLLTGEDGTRHPLPPAVVEMTRLSSQPVIDLSETVGGEAGRRFVLGMLREMGVDERAADGLGEYLFRRTGGHAMFAVELYRWLRDRRQLQRERDGTWRPSSTPVMQTVPHKVRDMVAERVERLPDHLKRVLSVAAVQGQAFSVEILAAAAGLGDNEIASIIDDELVAHHGLLEVGDTITYGNISTHEYAFSHAMFREYLYDALAPAQRQRLHGQIAQAIVDYMGIDNNALAGVAAQHFAAGGKLQEAGFYAYLAGTLEMRQLEIDLATEWFNRSIEFATSANDMARAGRAKGGIARVMRLAGRFDEGIRLVSEVLEDAQLRGFTNLEGECNVQLGQFFYDLGELTSAETHLTRATEIYGELGNRFDLSGAELMLSHTYYRMGRYDDALTHARNAGQLSAELQHDDRTAEALLAAGNCENDLGMYERAITTYQQAIAIYRSAGDQRGEVLCTLNSGLANIQLGDFDEAIVILNGAMELIVRRRLERYLPFVTTYIALAYEGKGEHDRAAEFFRTARDRRRDSGLGGLAQDDVAGLLRIAVAHQDIASTRRYARELADWFKTQGDAGLEDPILAHLSLSVALELLGEDEESRASLETAHRLMMDRAKQLRDPDTVRSYLASVPTNRAVQARIAAMREDRADSIAHTAQETRGHGFAAL